MNQQQQQQPAPLFNGEQRGLSSTEFSIQCPEKLARAVRIFRSSEPLPQPLWDGSEPGQAKELSVYITPARDGNKIVKLDHREIAMDGEDVELILSIHPKQHSRASPATRPHRTPGDFRMAQREKAPTTVMAVSGKAPTALPLGQSQPPQAMSRKNLESTRRTSGGESRAENNRKQKEEDRLYNHYDCEDDDDDDDDDDCGEEDDKSYEPEDDDAEDDGDSTEDCYIDEQLQLTATGNASASSSVSTDGTRSRKRGLPRVVKHDVNGIQKSPDGQPAEKKLRQHGPKTAERPKCIQKGCIRLANLMCANRRCKMHCHDYQANNQTKAHRCSVSGHGGILPLTSSNKPKCCADGCKKSINCACSNKACAAHCIELQTKKNARTCCILKHRVQHTITTTIS